MFRLYTDLHRRVPAATTGVPERVRTGPRWMSAGHATVRVCVARKDAVRQAASAWRPGTVHGPGRVRAAAACASKTDQEAIRVTWY